MTDTGQLLRLQLHWLPLADLLDFINAHHYNDTLLTP